MALTAEQQAKREGKLTASQVGILMRGDAREIHNLWLQLIGSPDYVPPDFADAWPVQLGSHTEELNLTWFAKKYGPVVRAGEVVVHPITPWASCTLDGWDVLGARAIECKHVIQYKKLSEVLEYYQPQLHWIMYVTDTREIATSIIIGALEPKVDVVYWNDTYAAELIRRAEAFWSCVENLVAPVNLPPVKAPVRQEDLRVLDMQGNNAWAVGAGVWLSTKDASVLCEIAKKDLKALMEDNIGEAYGYGVRVKRSKDGSLRFSEMKE